MFLTTLVISEMMVIFLPLFIKVFFTLFSLRDWGPVQGVPCISGWMQTVCAC